MLLCSYVRDGRGYAIALCVVCTDDFINVLTSVQSSLNKACRVRLIYRWEPRGSRISF